MTAAHRKLTDMRPHRRDQGSVLPMALVFVVIFSVLAIAIATYTATALRTTDVTEKTVDRIASAESGATHALEAVAAADGCATYSASLNDAAVTTTCAFQRRAVNADGLYAMVITDLGGGPYAEFDTGTCPNPNCTRRIAGPIYLEENVDLALEETQSVYEGVDPKFTGGEVAFNVPGNDCTAPIAETRRLTLLAQWDDIDELNGGADVTPFVRCDSRGWEVAAPTPDLNAIDAALAALPPMAQATVPTSTHDCEVFQPGVLSSTSLTIGTDAFFGSGVYHFEDVDILIQDGPGGTSDPVITVGTRSEPRYQPIAISAACAEAMDDGSGGLLDDGTGAIWVLSGTSNVVFDKSTTEFYPRDVGVAPDHLDVSLLADHDPAAPVPASTLDPATTPLLNRQNPVQTRYSFHGHVWTPGSWIASANASGAATLDYSGGIVAARLELRSAANVEGINISVPVDTFEYYLIESTAVNDGDTTVRVVAFDDGSADGLKVESWRVCSRNGC